MGRDFNSYFKAQSPVDYSVNKPIASGIEDVIGENINYLFGKKLVPIVCHLWPEWIHADTAADGSTYWTLGSWRRKVQRDFAYVTCVIRAKNTNDTNLGRVKFTLASNSATAVVSVPANQTETTLTVDLPMDTAQTLDTIEVSVLDPTGGNSGKVYLQSVTIYTKPSSSPISAGVKNSGFIAIDSADTSAEAPMSTYLRSQEFESLDAIYKKRVPGTVLSFSAHYDERDATLWLYRIQAAAYQEIATLPIYVPPGVTTLGVAVQGWTTAGSTAAKLKLTTQLSADSSISTKESANFSTSWTYGDENASNWETDASALTVKPGCINQVKIEIKSDGTRYAYLAGLNIWMADVA